MQQISKVSRPSHSLIFAFFAARCVLWTWVAAWEEFMREKYGKSSLGKYSIRKERSMARVH
jgi:hypothetical protein